MSRRTLVLGGLCLERNSPSCLHRHQMPLKNRVYICPDCGNTEDRYRRS